jgi:hypothetical protein
MLIFPKIKAAIDAFSSASVEAHVLNDRIAQRIPKRSIGCTIIAPVA